MIILAYAGEVLAVTAVIYLLATRTPRIWAMLADFCVPAAAVTEVGFVPLRRVGPLKVFSDPNIPTGTAYVLAHGGGAWEVGPPSSFMGEVAGALVPFPQEGHARSAVRRPR